MRSVAISVRHPRLRVSRDAVVRAIARLDAAADDFRGGCPAGELSLVFLTDRAIAAIHEEFMDDPTPTDVITFPGEVRVALAGEICVSADAALWHVAGGKGGTRARDEAFSNELALYVIHGWLHLAGYDDKKPAARRAMRLAESRAMRRLRAAGAIPRFRLVN